MVFRKKLSIVLNKLSNKRSENADDWFRVVWCIINICKKEQLNKRICYKLIHLFSKKAVNYDEYRVDEFIDKNIDNNKEEGLSWNYLYQTCLKEDDIDYYTSINTKNYYVLKREFEEKRAKILHPPMIIEYNDDKEYIIYPLKSCKDSYEHIDCKNKEIVKEKTEWITKKFINIWLKDDKIRNYDKIVFKPTPLECKKTEFNTWINFKISNEPLIKTDIDYFGYYCDYMNNLVGNKEIADFLLARYAYRIQKPAFRTEVCVIYCGCEGDGKNKLLEPIYKIMDKYTCMLDSAKKLYDTHSMYEKDKLFILINEAGGTANFENSDTLKTRITEKELSINPKGIQAFTIDNLCDYDMTTNNFNVVKLSDDSFRRFLQIETTSYYRGNTAFFNEYQKNIVENPIALRQIYEGLMKFDISKIIPSGNFQTDKPTTDIEKEVKKQNRDKFIWFFEDILRGSYCKNKEEVKFTNDDLFKIWNNWCEKTKVKLEFNKIQFGIKISQIMKKQLNINGNVCIIKNNHICSTIFHIKALKNYFTKLNGYEFIDEEDIVDEN